MSGSDCPERALYIRCPDAGSVAVVISERTDVAGESALSLSAPSSLPPPPPSPPRSSLSSRSLRYFLMSTTFRLSRAARFGLELVFLRMPLAGPPPAPPPNMELALRGWTRLLDSLDVSLAATGKETRIGFSPFSQYCVSDRHDLPHTLSTEATKLPTYVYARFAKIFSWRKRINM